MLRGSEFGDVWFGQNKFKTVIDFFAALQAKHSRTWRTYKPCRRVELVEHLPGIGTTNNQQKASPTDGFLVQAWHMGLCENPVLNSYRLNRIIVFSSLRVPTEKS